MTSSKRTLGMLAGCGLFASAFLSINCSSSSTPATGGGDSGAHDSGVHTDSATATDSGSAADSTVANDTGTGSDTSVGGDTGMATDTSVATETGADTGVPTDAPAEAAADTGGGGDAGDTLTVLNYLKWCSVTVNGGTASTAATITAPVTAGTSATIVATPKNANFAIGTDPWFGTDQNDGGAAPGTDVGSGTTETSTVTVLISGSRCVSVCCGDAPGGTNCPTTNPCP